MAKSSKAGGPVANTCEFTEYECERLHKELPSSQSPDITHLHSQQCETFKYILDLVNAPNATESEQFLKELHCPTNGWPPIPQPVMLLVSLQGPKYWNVGTSKATACNGLVNIDTRNGLSYLSFKNGYQADVRRLPMTSNPDDYKSECAKECLGDNKCVASYVENGVTYTTVECRLIHQSDTITTPQEENCGFGFAGCASNRAIYVKGQNGTDFCPLGGP
eukprot:scaffold69907_cov29-Cyclotella_meneghiniana.AAC.1